VQGADAGQAADVARQRAIVDAFLAASRGGHFDALLELLDPDVVLRADAAAVQTGATAEVHGAAAVAETFSGRARVAKLALLDGSVGAVWSQGGRPRVVFGFTIAAGKIVAISLIADAEHLDRLDISVLDD
jgi:RNA polymerase sigma-70 factor (ECF subfamily)